MRADILKAYEKAARIYCEKLGDDPDQEMALPAPEGAVLLVNGPQRTLPRWHFVAIELHDLSLRLIALKEAVQAPTQARAPKPVKRPH